MQHNPPMWLWSIVVGGLGWEMALMYFAITKPHHPATDFLIDNFKWMIMTVFLGLMYVMYCVSRGTF